MTDAPPADDLGWVAMASRAVARAHYDPFTRRLWLVFTGGPRAYQFDGVPPAKWALFKAAPSKGAFYAQHLKGRYPAR